MTSHLDSQNLEYTFTWKIENLLLSMSRWNEPIISPTFTVNSVPNVQWCLRLHTATAPTFVSCYLHRLNDDGPNVATVGFRIFLPVVEDANPRAKCFSTDKYDFGKGKSYGKECLWKWKNLLQNKSTNFPNGTFTVRCNLWVNYIHNYNFSECVGLTHIEIDKIFFEKFIDNFSFMAVGSEEKYSGLFSSNTGVSMSIRIYKVDCDSITLDLKKTCESPDVLVSCKLSILDGFGSAQYSKEFKRLFQGRSVDASWRLLSAYNLQYLMRKNVLADDTLRLRFEFSLSTGKMESRILESRYSLIHHKAKNRKIEADCLGRDLKNFFLEKKFADVQLQTDSEYFLAHKNILRARSPVFEAMFSADMSEKETSIVYIADIDARILNLLLVFIYSGEIELEENCVQALYIAADKYQVLSLKAMCVSHMEQNLTMQNVCQTLQLADMHQDEILMECANEFFWRHRHEVLNSDKWQYLTTKNIELASTILKRISIKCLKS